MRIIILFLFVFIGLKSYTQERDYKRYDKAIKLFKKNDLEKSKEILIKIIDKKTQWDEPYILLSNIYLIENDLYNSAKTLLNIYDIENASDYLGIEKIAKDFYKNGFYSEALYYFNVVCKLDSMYCKEKINFYIKNCDFAISEINDNISDPVSFNPINIGPSINSSMSEIGPAITSDNNKIVFTRRVEEKDKKPQEDFYFSEKINNEWQKAIAFPYPLNTNDNEGALSFSSDQSLIIYTACNREDGFGSCDLYYGYNNLDNLEFYNLGKSVNSKFWDSQACFSSDRKYLYFVSNRPGGYGGTDIWISEITKNGFAPAYNAGPVINTKKDEMSPFIHADNLNLYFSSKGHVGMGDYDLFLSNRDSITSKWKKPKNIGYPINDHKSQNSMIVSSDGKTAYFNSSFEGYGSDDIFYFDLPNNIQATPLNNIELDIIVSKIGEEIILKNVHFSNNSYVLNDSSKIELNKLSDYLINYKIKIKIEGHTDSNGDSNLNLVLSNNRAKSVNDYLISNGVEQNQLIFSGYGDSRPIADNNSKEGRAINRRTSFIIID